MSGADIERTKDKEETTYNQMKGYTMTRKSRKNQRRVIASLLTGLFLVQQTMTLTVVASEISGVAGSNGVFNIDPATKAGELGFRHYEKFNLSQGDIANLNYTDISTFVNMVDNQININGVLNTMKNGAFYNGKAIFVSPNGMVVGASGVLNVGSLGVYTPDQVHYQNLVKNPGASTLADAQKYNAGGAVTINGKIFAANDVNINGGQVTVGQNAGVFAGVNETQIANNLNNADALFNQLVNTNNLTSGSTFTSDNGNIVIKANQNSGDNVAGVDIAGHVMNYGKGNTEIYNYMGSDNGTNISGTVANREGTLKIQNNQSGVDISGTIINKGNTEIYNLPVESGNLGTMDLNADSGISISGNINTEGDLTIQNTGYQGIDISGNVTNNGGDVNIQNGSDDNTYYPVDNTKVAELNISGNLTNTNGNTSVINYGAGGLNVDNSGTVTNTGDLTMLNTGAGGLTINGEVDNAGHATVTNEAGALNIGGSFTNNGTSDITNNGTVLNVSGTVNNQNGTLNMTNNGAGGFNVTGNIDSQGANLTNNAGNLNLGGTFTNSGDATVLNDGTALNASGSITNTDGTLTMTNNGDGGFTVTESGNIHSEGLDMTNNAGSLDIDGSITNNGTGNYENYGSGFNINGTVENNGAGTYYNNGAEGLNINGSVTNAGQATVTNDAGRLNIAGSFSNTGSTQITNNGSELNVSGKVTNKNGNLAMNNAGDQGFNITETGKVSTLQKQEALMLKV